MPTEQRTADPAKITEPARPPQLAALLALPPADRLRLADALYDSCDAPDDAANALDEDQIREIDRRAAEVAAGTAELVPADEVFRHALERTRG